MKIGLNRLGTRITSKVLVEGEISSIGLLFNRIGDKPTSMTVSVNAAEKDRSMSYKVSFTSVEEARKIIKHAEEFVLRCGEKVCPE